MKKFLIGFMVSVGFMYMVTPEYEPYAEPVGILEINEQPSMYGDHSTTHFVSVEPQYIGNVTKLKEFSKFVCEGKNLCIVMFWGNNQNLPEDLPMTSEQLKYKRAHYSHNIDSGYKQMSLCPNGDLNYIGCEEVKG